MQCAAPSTVTAQWQDGTGRSSDDADASDAQGDDLPRATTSVFLSANLDSSSGPLPVMWDPANPEATSNFFAPVTIYDSLGTSHEVDIFFRNVAPEAWHYYALVKSGDVKDASGNIEFAWGNLTFTSSGALPSLALSGGAITFAGAVEQTVTFDFGSLPADLRCNWARRSDRACGSELREF